ncbi:MAG: GerW family sporulation protein [Lachnospirales bacterium]
MSKSVNEALVALLGNIEGVLNSKSVVGEPVQFGKNIIIPLVEIGFGMGAGGSDTLKDDLDTTVETAGGGMGGSVKPTAILVVNDDGVQLVDVKNKDSVNKVIDMLPALLSKFVGTDNKSQAEKVVDEVYGNDL